MDAIGLIDCNNFYCSAERVFDVRLKTKPVAVLSNNDGCIISRSQEVKDLGVKMGAPFFQVIDRLDKSATAVFSSNYALYGDMSARVMETLHDFSPQLEVYSIDEAFLGFQESKKSFDFLGREIQDKVYKHVGIPVGVGIASNKTLAKVANRLAKKSRKAKGVVDIYNKPELVDVALERTPIAEVWGIGKEYAEDLIEMNIRTAQEFKFMPGKAVKYHFTVKGLRTWQELNGVRALDLVVTPPLKKSITCSLSFGEPLERATEIFNAVSSFLQTAVAKLRDHRLAARALKIYLSTNKFGSDYQSRSCVHKSAYPADNLFELQSWAGNCFDKVFRPGLVYRKAGIELLNLIPREGVTERMFREERLAPRLEKLNQAMDEINRKYGKNTVHLAAAQKGRWQSKRERLSPCYTTRLSDILKVR